MSHLAQARDITPDEFALVDRLIAEAQPEPRHVAAADALLALDVVTAESVRKILEKAA